MAFQQSVLARNAQADTFISQVGTSALLRIYTGTVPANCAAAATGTKLSEHTCSASAFAPSAANGVLSPNLPANVNGLADGTAGYYRVYKSDGTTCVMQDSVVASGPGLVLNPSSNLIANGQPVQINSWSITMGGA